MLTAGGRLFGEKDDLFGAMAGLDYSVEGAYEFGGGHRSTDLAEKVKISAYAINPRLGFHIGPTRLGAEFYRASGDNDATDGVLRSFNPMWQDPHGRFGNLDRFVGSNLQMERLSLDARLAPGPQGVVLGAGGYFLQVQSPTDNLNGAFRVPASDPTSALPVAAATAGHGLGVGGDFTWHWQATPNVWWNGDVSAFAPSGLVKDTLGLNDALLRVYGEVGVAF